MRRRDNLTAYLFLSPWLLGLFLITDRADDRLALPGVHRLQPDPGAAVDRAGELQPDAVRRAAAQLAAGDLHLRLRLGPAAARASRCCWPSSWTAASAGWPSTARSSTCRRCSARASRSRSCGGRCSAPRDCSTRCSALVGIEGKGWISDPSTALGTLVVLNVWTFGVADGDLPGRPAADPDDVLRGRRGRRRRSAGAGSSRDHAAAAHADHLLQPGAADHPRVPVVHPGLRGLRRHRRTVGLDDVLHALPLRPRLRRTSTWATPRRWPGSCW